MGGAIDALERAFKDPAPTIAPQRTSMDVPSGGALWLMPAAGPAGTGVKLVTINPANPTAGLPFIHGAYALFAPGSLALEAVIEGGALTGLRTAAVSGLATRYLAHNDAHKLVLFGAGVQAHTHLDAMVSVRDIDSVRIVSRSPGPVERLVARARELGMDAAAGTPADVADADIICTCTTNETPVFDGKLLSAGAHVNAIGAYQPHTREVDDATVRRSRIVVETRAAALAEAGDLIIPISSGVLPESGIVADLAGLVAGAEVRRSDADITLFKSVGIAVEDLAVARAAVDMSGGS
jgi:ornithine cyclodeaminase/alanine dehydrogenase-like protein (mu-crystallin family)